jgi:DNA-binding NtrC family response regulator
MERRIVVLEDDDFVRDFVVATLEREGHRVTPAGSVPEGRKIIAESDAESLCVVADVVLNDESGIAFGQELLRQYPSCRVLLISGYTDEVVLTEPADAARAGFLAKPFTKDALVGAIERLYNRDNAA